MINLSILRHQYLILQLHIQFINFILILHWHNILKIHFILLLQKQLQNYFTYHNLHMLMNYHPFLLLLKLSLYRILTKFEHILKLFHFILLQAILILYLILINQMQKLNIILLFKLLISKIPYHLYKFLEIIVQKLFQSI